MTSNICYLGKALVESECDTSRGEFYEAFMIQLEDKKIFFYVTPEYFIPSTLVREVNDGRGDEESVVLRPSSDVFQDFDSFVESVVPEQYVEEIKEIWEEQCVEEAVIHLTDMECLTQLD